MKSLFKAFAIFGALVLPLSAQEGDGYGFLNIANLVPNEARCKISIGGEELVAGGLKAGAYTGWFMVKNGSKKIEVSIGEMEPGSGAIQIVEGLGNLIAIYLEPDPRSNTADEEYPPKLRIKSVPTYDTRGFGLKFVSLCPGENRFQLGSLKFSPKTLDAVEIPKWNGGGFEIIRNGSSVGKVSGSSEGGGFYLFVGTDGKEKYASVLISASNQEVPEYLKKDKAKMVPSTASSQTPAAEQ